MEKSKLLRASLTAIPLAMIVFAFGMLQVLGVDQSYASVKNLMSYIGFSSGSLLGSSPQKEGTFTVNGRSYQTRVGSTRSDAREVLADYDQAMTMGTKNVLTADNGGQIVQSDGRVISLVNVRHDDRRHTTEAMEVASEDIVTDRQRAIADDPVVAKIFEGMKNANVSPQRLRQAMHEYSQTQTMSDPVVAGLLNELYLRIDEIKSTIDVAGPDIEDVVRLPGSVRILSAAKRNGTVQLVAYANTSSLAENAAYYEQEFLKNDWQPIQGFKEAAQASDNLRLLLMRKPDRLCLIGMKLGGDRTVKTYLMQVQGFTSNQIPD